MYDSTTREEKEEVLYLYRKNHTLTEISEKVFMSPIKVSKILREYGIEVKAKRKLKDDEKEEMIRLFKSGYSFGEIASATSRPKSTVINYLTREGHYNPNRPHIIHCGHTKEEEPEQIVFTTERTVMKKGRFECVVDGKPMYDWTPIIQYCWENGYELPKVRKN